MMWRKKFFRFLKEENVYGEWIYNLRQQHPQTDLDFWECKLKEILSEDKKCSVGISSAFCWDSTKQGYNFWMKLDIKWNDKCGYWIQLL